MEEQLNKGEDLVLSASGKKVKKGEVINDRVPEILSTEIQWGTQIGGGCFGSVYMGKCRGINVAIKKLLKQNLDSKILEEFRKEVDIMTQMRHPNIILFLGACTEEGKMCIVCELLKDNVYNILHKSKIEITTLQRLKIAKDTAAGMAWLHGATPQIIHRDLKPQNLLVDEHWNVKVCDFGLSQVKIKDMPLRDGKSIPGTPLWMAPEVLMGKEITEKADVYSYGIVLWEIMTSQEPFQHHNSYNIFKKAIVKDNERPVITKQLQEQYPSLTNLMQKCWHADPSSRPSFTQIIPIIESVIIDCLIDDPIANKFWKNNFLTLNQVPWNKFQNSFATLLGYTTPINSRDINFTCLKKLIATSNTDPNPSDPDMVTLEKFGNFINWFGPLEITKGNTILDKVRLLMQKDWFHGDISKEIAEDLLIGQPKGTFLIRTSITEKNCPFTISKVSSSGKINHQRIHKTSDGKFEITIKYSNGKIKKEESKKDNLILFISSISHNLNLNNSCPGSRYKSIFMESKVEGYLGDFDDDI